MDGVILDSNPLHRENWKVYNRRFGLETTEAMLQGMYGKRNDDVVRARVAFTVSATSTCSNPLTLSSSSVAAGGGAGKVAVSAPDTCAWTI